MSIPRVEYFLDGTNVVVPLLPNTTVDIIVSDAAECGGTLTFRIAGVDTIVTSPTVLAFRDGNLVLAPEMAATLITLVGQVTEAFTKLHDRITALENA